MIYLRRVIDQVCVAEELLGFVGFSLNPAVDV